MPEIRVSLFGYPRVECQGKTVTIPRRKALALLAYLCVTQSHHSRDVLASLLWPEEESAKSYAFLRNALWVLHQTPIEPWILATRHMVGLRADASLWVDVAEFRRLLQTCQRPKHSESALSAECADALRVAVDLARDRFLAGFTADDSRAFEEWQFSEADILSQELALAFEKLSDHYEAAGDVDTALLYAQRRLTAQTLDEGAYRRVMRLLAKRGDRAAALRVFEDCLQVLDLELSLTPSEETRTLADDIRSRPFTAPAPRTAPRRNFPAYRLPLVGREADVARVSSLLAQDDCRLLTLTGTGGAGKTRLAVEIAEQATGFSDGAVFVSLVDVETPALAPPAIVKALGDYTERRGNRNPNDVHGRLTEVVRHLAERDLLIVLDNIEHLGRDVRWLSDLVADTHGPRFLATSRQELGVPGEWVYSLEGLEFPPVGSPTPAPQFSAVQLFLQAARRADARFSPSPADIAAIGSIARLLQGSPLGIELAASWVRTMPCAAIEAEISKSVDFLKTDQQLVPRRHRSLRAAFEGSWGLLDRQGRNAFRTLSVFRGGFTPESALHVGGVTLPGLASLVAKSLLTRSATGRYEMLEVVRQYATERLRTVPDEDATVQNRHADYFLVLLASQASRLKRFEQREANATLTADAANIFAAWRRAASERQVPALMNAAMGLFLQCDMTREAEAASLFGVAADAAAAGGPAARAETSYLKGLQAWFVMFDDPPAARCLFAESLRASDTAALEPGGAFIRVLAAFAGIQSPPISEEAIHEAKRLFEEAGLIWEVAVTLEALAAMRRAASPREALEYVGKSLALRHDMGDFWGVAMSRYVKALCHEMLDETDHARSEYETSAALRTSLGIDPFGLMSCYLRLAALESRAKNTVRAAEHLEAALVIATRIHHRPSEAQTHEGLAVIARESGKTAEAQWHAQSAAELFESLHQQEAAERCRALLTAPHGPGSKRQHKG